MSNQLVKHENRLEFNEEQIKLIKSMIAEKATDNELKMFLYQCQRTGLDPMTRQIYCIHRGNRMTIQTSIDGFRVIAERSGDYAGQDKPVFLYNESKQLIGCEVTVFRFSPLRERYAAATGVAYWGEYCPAPPNDNMWKKMPHNMLSKVAEALALRKAFPQDLSGLYTTEEMQQSESEQPSFDYTLQMQTELENLLENSTYDSGSKAYADINRKIEDKEGMTQDLFHRIKNGLLSNQLPADQRGNMNEAAVKKTVKRKSVVTDVKFEDIQTSN
jgi:phage recombination protein Bet